MQPHWIVQEDSIKISKMPFYWRLGYDLSNNFDVENYMPMMVKKDEIHDYLKYVPTESEWKNMENAYRKDQNIGFMNPESGQMSTYGNSFNKFILQQCMRFNPKKIFEIGCGAGFTIKSLNDAGFSVIGIDPSDYSKQWSKKLSFKLINSFLTDGTINGDADFIYCNDVFEHIVDVSNFSLNVFNSLIPGGVFCVSTTNSQKSIELGDISMFEHQHVNMFTKKSIESILKTSGFSDVIIQSGTYGNTFQVIAIKGHTNDDYSIEKDSLCDDFFKKAKNTINEFEIIYKSHDKVRFYVPLRCIPYLSTVGDFGRSEIYDSNKNWKGKYIDGYYNSVKSMDDIIDFETPFFIGSNTFFDEIKSSLENIGYASKIIFGIHDICKGSFNEKN